MIRKIQTALTCYPTFFELIGPYPSPPGLLVVLFPAFIIIVKTFTRQNVTLAIMVQGSMKDVTKFYNRLLPDANPFLVLGFMAKETKEKGLA